MRYAAVEAIAQHEAGDQTYDFRAKNKKWGTLQNVIHPQKVSVMSLNICWVSNFPI